VAGYTFDHIVARLRCPVCGAVSPADDSTEMTTKLRPEPELAFLGIGDRLDFDARNAAAGGYIVLAEPDQGEEVVLLHTWTCPTCGTAFQWARIVVRDGVIAEIDPIALDHQAIDRANYIVDDAKLVAAELDGRSPLELSDADAARALRDRLP
jgi:rubredoxin